MKTKTVIYTAIPHELKQKSLLARIQKKDKKSIKKWEEQAATGKVMRIM